MDRLDWNHSFCFLSILFWAVLLQLVLAVVLVLLLDPRDQLVTFLVEVVVQHLHR